MTEEDLKQIERRLCGDRNAFPSDMPTTITAVGESRLKDIQRLLAEVRELKLDVKVLTALVQHYNSSLIRTLKEADAMSYKKQSPSAPVEEEEDERGKGTE